MRELGIDQNAMRAAGLVFAVRRVEADYLSPAKFDDVLRVETSLAQVTGARLVLEQVVTRGDTRLFAAKVTIVCLGEGGQPARLPDELRRLGR